MLSFHTPFKLLAPKDNDYHIQAEVVITILGISNGGTYNTGKDIINYCVTMSTNITPCTIDTYNYITIEF